MRTYILADNQNITCIGMTFLIKEVKPKSPIYYAENRSKLIELLKTYPNAIIILDYTLFDFYSIEQLFVLRESVPSSSWILFSEYLSDRFIREALIATHSFNIVMKRDSKETITKAIDKVEAYQTFYCDLAKQVLNEEINQNTPPINLTNSKKQILREIALGKTTKEIAWEKKLSFHTINAHRKNIFRKLEVNNVHEAIRYAFRIGIIDPAEYIL